MSEIVDYGYKGKQYYYWERYDDGSMDIENGCPDPNDDPEQYGMNYARKKVNGVWCYYCEMEVYNEEDGSFTGYSWQWTTSKYYEDEDCITASIVSGDGAALTGGAGDDYIENYAEKVKISSGNGNDEIYNVASKVTISGGDGDDTIYTYGKEKVSIHSGAGNDYISNYAASVTIDAGADNDTIINEYRASSVKILGGAGNDNISNSAASVTIDAGADNDTITNSGANVLIQYSGGNDVISGFNETSTLQISTGTFKKAVLNGSDVILSIDKSFVTLANAASNEFHNVTDKSGNKIVLTFFGTEGNDKINNSLASTKIDALNGNNKIYNSGNSVTITSGTGKDSVVNYGNAVEITSGNGIDTINNFGANVLIDGGLTKDRILNSGSYSTVLGGAGNDTIDNDSANVLIDGGINNDKIYNSGEYATIAGGAGNDSVFNEASNVLIDAGAGKDTVDVNAFNVTVAGGADNDKVIRNSLGINTAYVYTSGNDTLENFGYLNALVLDGVEINSSVRANGDVKLSLSNKKTLTLKNYLSTKINVILSTEEILKFDSLYNDNSEKVFKGTAQNNYIVNEGDTVTVNAQGGDDYILNIGTNDVSLSGGAGNDEIYNLDAASNTTIDAGDGDDFIYNEDGEDVTIKGRAGDDLIRLGYYAENNLILYNNGDGNDIIEGFNESSTLQIVGQYSTTTSGADIIVTVGEGSITLSNAAYLSDINIESGDSKLLMLDDSSDKKVKISSAIRTVDASDRTAAINLTGNKYANTISGGKGSDVIYGGNGNDSVFGGKGNDKLYGQNNNDTLWGGAGNDSLWGGNGADTFIYNSGEGKDIIYDFDNSDMLKITGEFSATCNADAITFKVDSTANALTLKNFTATTFNVNGTNYKISDNSFVKQS